MIEFDLVHHYNALKPNQEKPAARRTSHATGTEISLKPLLWIFFNLLVIFLLYLDLAVFHRKDEEIRIQEALGWSVIWMVAALIFNAGVYRVGGPDRGLKFFTGYLLERSLSVDNLFVFLVIFSYFKVPARYHYKILFWGILGAIVTRALFILGGIALIERFRWILYVLGAILIYSGFKLFSGKDEKVEPDKNPVVRGFRYLMPVSSGYESGKFFIREQGRWAATPLFVVLLVIETTDVIFSMDSIPAILSISLDPFIVYSSNIFAILGLRALYFALAGLMKAFYYLHYGLGVILIFVGVKMLAQPFFSISTGAALGVITAILMLSILASLIFPSRRREKRVESGKKLF